MLKPYTIKESSIKTPEPMESYRDLLDSPLGPIEILASDRGVTHISFDARPGQLRANAVTEQCKRELQEYIAGVRRSFEVPLAAAGTEFERSVWHELMRLAYGETVSYGEIAKRINNPGAVRAVGLANGKNPIAIVVPCHRVIGANGKLTGYGGELWRKQWLLHHEAKASGSLLF